MNNDNWQGPALLQLLMDRGGPLHLTLNADAAREPHRQWITLSRPDYQRTVDVDVREEAQAATRLQHMLRHYPHPVTINGRDLEWCPAPTGMKITRYDYSGDSASSYQVSHLGFDQPEQVMGLNALVAGVRYPVGGYPLPWNLAYHVRQPGTGNRYWQRASRIQVDALCALTAEEIAELKVTERNTLQILRETTVWRRLRAESMERLEAAIAGGHAPARKEGRIYQMALGYDASYDEMHDGGAPIFVDGWPVKMDDATNRGWHYITLAQALYRYEQEMVPVAGHLNPSGNQDIGNLVTDTDELPQVRLLAVSDGRSPEDQGRDFAPITGEASVTLKVEGDNARTTIPADIVIDGERYGSRVSWRPGCFTPETVSDLMCRAYWEQSDFNECADSGDALSDMQSDYFEQATAGMVDQDQGFTIQLQRMLDNIRTSVPYPETQVSVTTRDGRFTLSFNPAARADDSPTGQVTVS